MQVARGQVEDLGDETRHDVQTQDGACGPKQELHLQPRWVITGDDMGTLGESAIGAIADYLN